MIVLYFDFDYNMRTFVPTGPPHLMDFDAQIQDDCGHEVETSYTTNNAVVTLLRYEGKEGQCVETSMVFPLSNPSVIPIVTSGSWEEIVEYLSH